MIHLLVVALIFMSIVGAAGYGFLNMSHSVDMLYSTQSDKVLLSKWVIALENGRMEHPINGRALAPLGVNVVHDYDGNGKNDLPYHILPDGFGLPKTNSHGRYYIYCPVGNPLSSVTSDQVNIGKVEGDNSSYDVSLISNGSVQYVAESGFRANGMDLTNVAGFILSPYLNDVTAPSCSDISTSKGRYHAPGAMVGVVNSGFSDSERISKTIVLAEDADLSLISNEWKLGSEVHYFINIPPVSMPVSQDIDLCFGSDRYPRKIHLKGSFDGGSISELVGNSKIKVKACNVDLYISDMSLSAISIDAEDSSIDIKDSNIGDLKAVDSEVSTSGIINITATNSKHIIELASSSMDVKDSVLKIRAKGTLQEAVMLDGSSVHLDSSNVRVAKLNSGATAIATVLNINESSELYANKTTFNVSTQASIATIVNQGKLDIIESTISISNNNKGILLKDGGTLGLNSNAILHMSGSSTTAVVDESSLGVYGSSARITAGICWSGRIFENSTRTSSRTINESMITNRSDWTCN